MLEKREADDSSYVLKALGLSLFLRVFPMVLLLPLPVDTRRRRPAMNPFLRQTVFLTIGYPLHCARAR